MKNYLVKDSSFISPLKNQKFIQNGNVSARSPSNIAIVKYWGKKHLQIPINPSVSFTLTSCFSKTNVTYKPKSNIKTNIKFWLDGIRNLYFEKKIKLFFQLLEKYLPWLASFDFQINSSNSFPHSSGIASSASGMSALVICLMKIEKILSNDTQEGICPIRCSFYSRLGSGSACRSIFAGINMWGKHQKVPESSNLYAIPLHKNIHKDFLNYQNSILIIEKGVKQVSSREGHKLMNKHPFSNGRVKQANIQIALLLEAFKSGDIDLFGNIAESEALTLHAMMMTSNPYFILMKPQTLTVIEQIKEFRQNTKYPLYFTMDAGANLHLLYPFSVREKIKFWIKENLSIFCQDKKIIFDRTSK